MSPIEKDISFGRTERRSVRCLIIYISSIYLTSFSNYSRRPPCRQHKSLTDGLRGKKWLSMKGEFFNTASIQERQAYFLPKNIDIGVGPGQVLYLPCDLFYILGNSIVLTGKEKVLDESRRVGFRWQEKGGQLD
jgi:hypothetical protein